MNRARILPATLAWALALAPAAAAQVPAPARPTLSGLVVDRHTGRPVRGARVIISGVADTIAVADDGSFRTSAAGMGAHVVEVDAIGYAAARWILELGEAAAEVLFELDARLPVLDSLTVAARRDIIKPEDWRSPQSFEHRRRRGGGAFLTEEQIRQSHARNLSDLLPMVPGVMVTCTNQGRNCSVLMQSANIHRCQPDYYLDGAPATSSTGPSFPVQGIRAIEVYRAGDEPIEFSQPNAHCGIIAIWTKMER